MIAPWRELPGPLVDHYDALLLDLDGVVYRGNDPVIHAVASLSDVHARGMKLAYVTNNAARTPETVAEHLRSLGLPADARDVVTSAQAGARALAALVPVGADVLIVGGPGLEQAVSEVGRRPIRRIAEGAPVAVIQGHNPQTVWTDLAEAGYLLATGVPWVATNGDLTVPTDRGIAPGNGSFVQILAQMVGRTPDVVAGKPQVPLMHASVERVAAQRPLVVGDRLDTDIEAAVAAGIDSLLVLTGVTTLADVVAAPEHQRPTYVARDLRVLCAPMVADDGVAQARAAALAAWGEPRS